MQTRDEDRSGGFTLLELLLVTLLLGLLFGIGLGVLSSLDLGKRAALGSVQNVVRAARNSAVARNAPASVRLDAKDGWIRARAAEQVVGTWHFEGERDGGAFDLTGDNQARASRPTATSARRSSSAEARPARRGSSACRRIRVST
jgi:prepilin-type N-terminal cleavage/methylation domain-containing protein